MKNHTNITTGKLSYALTNQIIMTVIFILGTFGNITTLVVFFRQKKSLITPFFIVLAVSDSVSLVIGMFFNFMLDITRTMSAHNVNKICKSLRNMSAACGAISGYILVAMTSFRAASILWPHRIKSVWTPRASLAFVSTLTTILTGLEIPGIYFSFFAEETSEPITLKTMCTLMNAPAEVLFYEYNILLPGIELVNNTLAPVLLALSNGCLVWGVRRSARAAQDCVTSGVVGSAAHASRATSVTRTLIFVSLTFFLLTAPLSFVYFVSPGTFGVDLIKLEYPHSLASLKHVAIHMYFLNSAVNFYIYCLTGSNYRSQVKSLFCT